MADSVMEPIKSGAVTPAFGTNPFGDKTEVSGAPVITTIPDSYRRFFATDARSVLVTLLPNHFNFIKNPSFRTDTTGWEVVAPAAVLPQATWHVDSSQILADGSGMKAVKGSNSVFGTAANKPLVLPWTGSSYTYQPQDTANANYLSLPLTAYAPTDTVQFDVDLSTSADITYVVSTSYTANGCFLVFFNGTSLTYRLKWASANQDYTWTTVRLTGRHVYRIMRTTTTVELFVDDVSKGAKTLTQTVSGSASQDLSVGLTGTTSSAERSRYYEVRIGTVAIMSPSAFTSDYTQITNLGSAGGVWTVNRAATGLKLVIVDRPLVMFAGGMHYSDTTMAQTTGGTLVMLVREYADSAVNQFAAGSGTTPPTTGGFRSYMPPSSVIHEYDSYGTGGASVVSTKTMAAHGTHTFAVALSTDGTTMSHWVDGALVVSKAGPANAIMIKDRIRIGSSGGNVSFIFQAAAFFDRVLTTAEVAQVGTDLNAWRSTQTLLSTDSWVGNSITVNGDAVVRYRDSGYYVYVGIPETIPDRVFNTDFEPGTRMSAEWTFSAYLKGTGRARLVMDAYYPTQAEVAYSPPINQGLTTVSDPSTANYGNASVLDPNGVVWTRDAPPFYVLLGTPPTTTTNPGSITTQGLLAPAVVDGRNSIWEITTPYPAQAPYYTEWGVPVVKNAPYEENAGAKYIQDNDGVIYQLISPLPGAKPYYRAITPPMVEKPEYIIPDKAQFEPFYIYSGTQLWQIKNPIPAAPPYYQLMGTFAAAPGDPTTIPPGNTYVSYSRTVTPPPPQAPIQMTEIWQVVPKPYYTSTGSAVYAARVVGDWVNILDRDWQRLVISTSARWPGGTSFAECSWIDARIEIDDASGLKISSFLLDPNEAVTAEYFDGAMAEAAEVDDYLWEDTTKANNSISWYYYDRRTRARWLYENLPRLVPANRPVQIYFNDFKHPYTPGSTAGVQSQSRELRPRIGL